MSDIYMARGKGKINLVENNILKVTCVLEKGAWP